MRESVRSSKEYFQAFSCQSKQEPCKDAALAIHQLAASRLPQEYVHCERSDRAKGELKTAVIGTGISGLGMAYLLEPHFDIVVYEKNAYLGGHCRTVDVEIEGKRIAVDTGFIVFNDRNYPNLSAMFKHLGVAYTKSDMSFGADIGSGWLAYSSNDLFAPLNLLRPAYWGMLRDIVKFNKSALAYIDKDPSVTLGQCLDELRVGEWFKNYYLLAMGASIWDSPKESLPFFPARTFLRFFKNHGLLSVNDHPQWHTVQGGSREYVRLMAKPFSKRVKLSCGVEKVTRKNGKIEVHDAHGQAQIFDQVIFCCHADEAQRMLDGPRQLKEALGYFTYQHNTAVLHGDTSFMPRRRKCWASWVYLSEGKDDTSPAVSLSYWMNSLQSLATDAPIIVTLNPARRPREDLVYDEHVFTHPVFDSDTIKAQARIDELQGADGLWFCGAHLRYGFHEDGLASAVGVAKKMGVAIPWA